MNRKMIWGIVAVLAFAFFWLILNDNGYPSDHFLLRVIRSFGFGSLLIGGTTGPVMVLIVLFTDPASFWSRFYRVLPFYLILILVVFIIISVKLTTW